MQRVCRGSEYFAQPWRNRLESSGDRKNPWYKSPHPRVANKIGPTNRPGRVSIIPLVTPHRNPDPGRVPGGRRPIASSSCTGRGGAKFFNPDCSEPNVARGLKWTPGSTGHHEKSWCKNRYARTVIAVRSRNRPPLTTRRQIMPFLFAGFLQSDADPATVVVDEVDAGFF
jgi:hypothetical protein